MNLVRHAQHVHVQICAHTNIRLQTVLPWLVLHTLLLFHYAYYQFTGSKFTLSKHCLSIFFTAPAHNKSPRLSFWLIASWQSIFCCLFVSMAGIRPLNGGCCAGKCCQWLVFHTCIWAIKTGGIGNVEKEKALSARMCISTHKRSGSYDILHQLYSF